MATSYMLQTTNQIVSDGLRGWGSTDLEDLPIRVRLGVHSTEGFHGEPNSTTHEEYA